VEGEGTLDYNTSDYLPMLAKYVYADLSSETEEENSILGHA